MENKSNDEALKFFAEYLAIKAEFDESCRNVVAANERRAVAEKRLGEINGRVMDIANRAMQDPTTPEPLRTGTITVTPAQGQWTYTNS